MQPINNHVCLATYLTSDDILSGTLMMWPWVYKFPSGDRLTLSRMHPDFHLQVAVDFTDRRWVTMDGGPADNDWYSCRSWEGSSSAWEIIVAWDSLIGGDHA